MKNLDQREGFVNRHTHGLPDHPCAMRVVKMDVDGEDIFLCDWQPFDKSKYPENRMPGAGYLGTAKVIQGEYTGIGFNVWEQNNYEFVWYVVV